MAWLPIFFLYLNQYVSLTQVVLLQSLYYGVFVVLEVPSGYVSDAKGRRITLLISQAALIIAYCLFLLGDGFALFAAAQIMLAAGMAFDSGTDTVFHYDSLHALGQDAEYGDREARVARMSLISSAVAVMAGGLLASYNLAYAYVWSLISSIIAFGIAWQFIEPQREQVSVTITQFIATLKKCALAMRTGPLSWLFGYSAALYILAHVPFELYQPYLQLLHENGGLNGLLDMDVATTSGAIFAMTTLLGAWVAGNSVKWQRKIGMTLLLLGALVGSIVIILGLASWLHWLTVALVIFRNVPMNIVHAPILSVITPRLDREYRATYLSLQSLVSRFAFSLALLSVSVGVTANQSNWETLSTMLWRFSLFGFAVFVVLILWVRVIGPIQMDKEPST